MADRDVQRFLDVMQRSTLFANVPATSYPNLSEFFTIKNYHKDDIVFCDGSFSEYVYFVESGEFEIVSYNKSTKVSKQLRKLGPGEHFSELSVLTNSRHHTSAFALESGTLFLVGRKEFHKMLKAFPVVAFNLAKDIGLLIHKTLDRSKFFKSVSDRTVIKTEAAMLNIVPLKMMQSFKVIPLRIEGQHVIIGMVNPLDPKFYHEFSLHSPKYTVRSVILNEKQYDHFLQSFRSFQMGMRSSIEQNIQSEDLQIREAPTNQVTGHDLTQERVNRLKKSVFFSKVPEKVISGLLPYFDFTSFEAFQTVLDPVAGGEHIILVLSGNLRVLKAQPHTDSMMSLFKIFEGDGVFDPTIFTGLGAKLLVRTNTACEICRIPKKIFEQLFKSVEFLHSVVVSSANILQRLNRFNDGIQIIDHVELKQVAALKNFFPEGLAKEFSLLPVQQIGSEVLVATSKPTNKAMIEAVEKAKPRFYFNFGFASDDRITYWRNQLIENIQPLDFQQSNRARSFVANQDKVTGVKEDSAQTFDKIIETAIKSGASDIHIECLQDYVLVRFRIDGELVQLWENIDLSHGQAIIRRAKVLGNLDISESRLPQDGQFRQTILEQEYGFRLSCVPTRYGEKAVLRLMSRSASVIPLRHLSNYVPTTEFLLRISKYKQGLFLVAGPTGSGKSTTIYSILNQINVPGVNLMTVEDPIEVNLPGVNQIEIQQNIGLTYDVVLRHLLRQDPDVIFIGEIRDTVSLQTAIDASMTGHLVLSTIHAHNSISVIPRLAELTGGQFAKIATTIIGVLAQRLVRILCPDCKISAPLTEVEVERINKYGLSQFGVSHSFHSVGCKNCYMTGFRGQAPVFEFWENNLSIAETISNASGFANLTATIQKNTFQSLEQYGLRMVALGITSFKEIDECLFGVSYDNQLTEQAVEKIVA